MVSVEELSADEIVHKLCEIKRKYFNFEYNLLEYITNDTTYYKYSRCKKFAIYFINKGKLGDSYEGILIELVKGNTIVSAIASSDQSEINTEKIISRLPIRFKEIIATIKKAKVNNQKITKELIDDILNLSVKGIKSKYIGYIDNHESLNSIIQFNFLDLIENKQKHTFIYVDLANFGKINRQKRASR